MYRFTSPAEFPNFTYSKNTHFKLFDVYDYPYKLYGKSIDSRTCDLKVYQDLLTFSFIAQNLKEKSRILEIGGLNSRVLPFFKQQHECWTIERLNEKIHPAGTDFKIVNGEIGNSSKDLPDNYFDLIFSISTLQNFEEKPEKFKDLTSDMNRVLKKGGFSLHCFDVIFLYNVIWTNDLLPFLFKTQNPVNPFIPFDEMSEDPDLFIMSETAFNKTWKKSINKPYIGFKPVSYNVLWQKEN